MNISIERGNPTPEEIAALVGVLAGLMTSTSERGQAVSAWWRSGLPVQRVTWQEAGRRKSSHI